MSGWLWVEGDFCTGSRIREGRVQHTDPPGNLPPLVVRPGDGGGGNGGGDIEDEEPE